MFLTFWRFRSAIAAHAGAMGGGALLVIFVAAMEVALPWPMKIIVDDVLQPFARGAHQVAVVDQNAGFSVRDHLE